MLTFIKDAFVVSLLIFENTTRSCKIQLGVD